MSKPGRLPQYVSNSDLLSTPIAMSRTASAWPPPAAKIRLQKPLHLGRIDVTRRCDVVQSLCSCGAQLPVCCLRYCSPGSLCPCYRCRLLLRPAVAAPANTTATLQRRPMDSGRWCLAAPSRIREHLTGTAIRLWAWRQRRPSRPYWHRDYQPLQSHPSHSSSPRTIYSAALLSPDTQIVR